MFVPRRSLQCVFNSKSKDYEMIKFREFLNTKEDDSLSTMNLLVRQSPSRDERVLVMDTKRIQALRTAMSTKFYNRYADNPIMSGVVRGRGCSRL